MKTTQSEHGFEMFDIVGHSMGTPVSLSLAAEKPDSVRSVLCVGGAGFDEEHTLPEMIVRAGRLAKHEIAPRGLELLEGSQPVKVIAAMTGHALRHPVHTLAEGYYVTHVDARTDLQRVRAKGIFVGAIIFGDDSFFDAQKVRTRTEGILDYAEFIADGQHIRPQQLPYRAAMEILAGLAMLNSQIKQPNSRISLRVS
jgi:pimeloyl-ACP methyl ester carboxylesterase